MGEFEEKLNALLSDSDAMAQVLQLAQNLSSQAEQASSEEPPQKNAKNFEDILGNFNPDAFMQLFPLIQQFGKEERSSAADFLYALRPFLKESRQNKVEQAVQLARIIHLAKLFLKAREG